MKDLIKCYCGHTTTCDCGPEVPKQETLDEFAKEFANNSAITNYEEGINVGKYQGFINGAKWQQERSYSEEEVIWALLLCSNKKFKNSLEVKEWWDNFQNK